MLTEMKERSCITSILLGRDEQDIRHGLNGWVAHIAKFGMISAAFMWISVNIAICTVTTLLLHSIFIF